MQYAQVIIESTSRYTNIVLIQQLIVAGLPAIVTLLPDYRNQSACSDEVYAYQ